MTTTFTLVYLCGHQYEAVFGTEGPLRYPKVNSRKADFTCGILACKTLDKGTYKLFYDFQEMVWYYKPSDEDSSKPHALERGALNLTDPCNLPALFSLIPSHEQEGSILVAGSHVRLIREERRQLEEHCRQLEERCRQLEEQRRQLAEQLKVETTGQGAIKAGYEMDTL